MLRLAWVAGLLLFVVACAAPSVPGVAAATPQSVAVQAGDVPSDLKKCADSGDIDSYLKNVKSKSPTSYQQVNDQWQKEKSAGATAGQVEVYADSQDECDALSSGRSPQSTTPPKIVLNYVVQFKDETSASKDYKDEVLGLNPADIQKQGA